LPCQYGDKPYVITQQLITDGRDNLVLKGSGSIALQCPVRLLHGLADVDVSWQKSVELAKCLQSKDVQITLIKNGDHRLSTDPDLALLGENLRSLILY
jgi:hypothetical protein